jgi:hypothetical protein
VIGRRPFTGLARGRILAAAVLVAVTVPAVSGCASTGASSGGKTCNELWAEHKACPPQKWHEENEGPSTYNHFHSTQP